MALWQTHFTPALAAATKSSFPACQCEISTPSTRRLGSFGAGVGVGVGFGFGLGFLPWRRAM